SGSISIRVRSRAPARRAAIEPLSVACSGAAITRPYPARPFGKLSGASGGIARPTGASGSLIFRVLVDRLQPGWRDAVPLHLLHPLEVGLERYQPQAVARHRAEIVVVAGGVAGMGAVGNPDVAVVVAPCGL